MVTTEKTTAELLDEKREELRHAELDEAKGSEHYDTKGVVQAQQRAMVLRQFIARLEAQAAKEYEAEARAAAEARLAAIPTEYTEVEAQLAADTAAIAKAMDGARAAIAALTATWHRYMVLRAENAALADHFGLSAGELPPLVVPVLRRDIDWHLPAVPDHGFFPPHYERNASHTHQRRTFGEIVGTRGYALIQRVGLKPWPTT